MSSSLRTPLAKVRGLGPAKEGTGDFIAQRASAVALAVLAPWFIISALLFVRDYETARGFVANPLNAIGLILLLLTGILHMHIGMRVVIEDYIGKQGTRTLLMLLNLFVCVAFAAAGLFAVLKISLGA